MIPYEPHPILFSIGPLAIRYYSLAYIAGFIIAYIALKKEYGKEQAEGLLSWLIVGVIVGARLGEALFYRPSIFFTDPLEIFMIWRGGMSFHGGLIGAMLAGWWYARKHKMQFLRLADTLVLPAAIGLAIGRIANWLNGELVGTVTNVAWCMEFPGYEGCRHPSQLYESFYMFVIAGVLWWRHGRKHQDGFLFVVFVTLYGLFRFSFNFLRDDPRWVLGLIGTGQLLSLLMFFGGLYVLLTKYKKSLRQVFR